ncbi:MAG: S41 family peptidase [bacterium]
MKKKLPLMFLFFILIMISCKDLVVTEPESNLNVADFEASWKRIKDVYPYLEFKKINWDSIYTIYRPRAEQAKGDDFYFVLRDLLAELKDGHVYYRTNGGGEVYPYYPQRHFKDRHAYSPFVVRKYFDKELRLTGSKTVEYEILPGNIGYAFLSDFHEDYLIREFPGVLEYLKNTKGLILDIRQKRGGDYKNIEAVITRFLTQPLVRNVAYTYGVKWNLPPFQPQGPFQYTNPVVVLINGSTFSAGEFTTEILKQLPNVTAVGDTTGGGSVGGGDEGLFFLPSGKSFEVGFIDIRRYDGLPWEWLGVAPDIRVEQTEADILAGKDNQLEYAIEMLK